MPNRLIVNVCGANASGKTTLVRGLIAASARTGLEIGLQDGTGIQGHLLSNSQLVFPVAVIGPYNESKYSGYDKIFSADAIEEAVRAAAKPATLNNAHVIFEGFRVSKSYSRFAALRNELTRADSGTTWLWVFLHAPEELIFERAQARRENGKAIDKKELSAVVRQMNKTRSTVRQLWPQDVLTLDPYMPPHLLLQRLLDEMAARERGETRGPA